MLPELKFTNDRTFYFDKKIKEFIDINANTKEQLSRHNMTVLASLRVVEDKMHNVKVKFGIMYYVAISTNDRYLLGNVRTIYTSLKEQLQFVGVLDKTLLRTKINKEWADAIEKYECEKLNERCDRLCTVILPELLEISKLCVYSLYLKDQGMTLDEDIETHRDIEDEDYAAHILSVIADYEQKLSEEELENLSSARERYARRTNELNVEKKKLRKSTDTKFLKGNLESWAYNEVNVADNCTTEEIMQLRSAAHRTLTAMNYTESGEVPFHVVAIAKSGSGKFYWIREVNGEFKTTQSLRVATPFFDLKDVISYCEENNYLHVEVEQYVNYLYFKDVKYDYYKLPYNDNLKHKALCLAKCATVLLDAFSSHSKASDNMCDVMHKSKLFVLLYKVSVSKSEKEITDIMLQVAIAMDKTFNFRITDSIIPVVMDMVNINSNYTSGKLLKLYTRFNYLNTHYDKSKKSVTYNFYVEDFRQCLIPLLRAYKVSEEALEKYGMNKVHIHNLMEGIETPSYGDLLFIKEVAQLKSHTFDGVKYMDCRLTNKWLISSNDSGACNDYRECERLIKKNYLLKYAKTFFTTPVPDYGAPIAEYEYYIKLKLSREGIDLKLVAEESGVPTTKLEHSVQFNDYTEIPLEVADAVNKLYGDTNVYVAYLEKLKKVGMMLPTLHEELGIHRETLHAYTQKKSCPLLEDMLKIIDIEWEDGLYPTNVLKSYKPLTGVFDRVVDIFLSQYAGDAYKRLGLKLNNLEAQTIIAELYYQNGVKYYSNPLDYYNAVVGNTVPPMCVINWMRCEKEYKGYPTYMLAAIHHKEYLECRYKQSNVYRLLCDQNNIDCYSSSMRYREMAYKIGADILDNNYDPNSGLSEHQWLLQYLQSQFDPVKYLQLRLDTKTYLALPKASLAQCFTKEDCETLIEHLKG